MLILILQFSDTLILESLPSLIIWSNCAVVSTIVHLRSSRGKHMKSVTVLSSTPHFELNCEHAVTIDITLWQFETSKLYVTFIVSLLATDISFRTWLLPLVLAYSKSASERTNRLVSIRCLLSLWMWKNRSLVSTKWTVLCHHTARVVMRKPRRKFLHTIRRLVLI